ncbi:MAG: hypothetical protein ABS976_21745, partial [Rhodococcus sp. (in: high G+C Gram-positive bacteria)]
ELAGLVAPMVGRPIFTLYAPQHNPDVTDFLSRMRMADDVELVRSSWIHYVHLAHVFAALNSSSAKNALGGAA